MHGFANVMSCQALPSRWQEGAPRSRWTCFQVLRGLVQGFSTYNRFPWFRKRKHHRGYLLEAGSSRGDPLNEGPPETQFEFCDVFNPFVVSLYKVSMHIL